MSSRLSSFVAWTALAGVAGAAALYPGHARLSGFYREVRRLEAEKEFLTRENEALREEIEILREDPFFIEKQAREMGFTREGEVIFRVKFAEEEEGDKAESAD